MNHFDLDALLAYADGSSRDAREIEAHALDCAECSAEIAAARALIVALGNAAVWEPAPAPNAIAIAFARQLRIEDADAKPLCDSVLSSPPAWRLQYVRKIAGTQTAGIIRELLARMRGTLEKSPGSALEMTSLAIELAPSLAGYPATFIANLHGQALRDHAFVLAFLGRHRQSLEYAERAEAYLERSPFERARLALVKAASLPQLGRGNEAATLVRDAAFTFMEHGQKSYAVSARMTEGALMYNLGNAAAALEIWRSIEGDASLDALGRARLAHNITLCLADLGAADAAVAAARDCIDAFERLDAITERTRSRAVLGRALLACGQYQSAIDVLRQTHDEFIALKLSVAAAIAALDLAQALLAIDDPEEVPEICREIIARLSDSDVRGRAATALSYLQEATERATPELLREAQLVLRRECAG